jgi:SigmaK-factor processing regulatory protein BofA
VESIILIILVVLMAFILIGRGGRQLGRFVVNALIGIVLLFLTNLFITPPIPINIITVLICAIGGVLGWLIILILYLLGVAFYVPA